MSPHIVVRRKGVGDTVAVSPLIRDLRRHFPDSRISVEGTLSSEIFRQDPRVVSKDESAAQVVIDYKPTHDRSRHDKTSRYLYAAHDDFELKTGIRVPRGPARPSLVLSDEERQLPDEPPYIVVSSGVKLDMPLKQYPHGRWAEIVRLGHDRGWRFKQIGEIHDGRLMHVQQAIPGAENLLGRTSIRQLFSIIAGASAVVCHVSLPMLVASAFEVPCVAIGGGRENPWLFADAGVEYLDTIGKLSCCDMGGCHASFPVPAHEFAYPAGSLCADPAAADDSHVGRCMTLISPETVVARVESLLKAKKNPGS